MSGALEPGGSVRLALTTCPDESTARRIARTLVEERLIACGNVVPDLTSIYRWQGVIEETGECLLLMKTPAGRLGALAERLAALHPYEMPELLVLGVEQGAGTYLRWVLEETTDPS
jgi:periplasmic divalent cation tolerance protein